MKTPRLNARSNESLRVALWFNLIKVVSDRQFL